MLCSESIRDFKKQIINEIIDISIATKLEKFTLRTDTLPMKAIENIINCLTKTITIKTVSILNHLNIRNIDFLHESHVSDKTTSQEIDIQQWKMYIICALRKAINLRTLDLSGNAINEEVAKYLAISLNKTVTLELLSLKDCSLGVALKSICLQKVSTLKYLDLSNNNLTEDEPIISILESNTMLEKLFIDQNHLKPTAGDKLSAAIANMMKLKVLSIDKNIIRKDMALKLAAAFSAPVDSKLLIYNCDDHSTEALDIKGPLHNIATLTLCKRSVEVKNISFLSCVLKAGVMLSLWKHDNALSKAEVIKSLSASRNITTLKVLNVSDIKLTEEEEDTITTIGNEGVNVIANSLRNITTLKHLDLSNNNITEYDQIVAILEANTGLERLDLEKNHLLTAAADKLSVAIANLKYLKVLNVDQSIIFNNIITAFSAAVDRRLIIHNQDHQGIEVMDIKGPLSNINTLTMCKFSNDVLGDASVRAHILETGTVLLPWSHSDILSTSRVLRYVSSSKQITTIKLLNISGSDLTKLEVDTIVNVINENLQINSVWLGSRSVKAIADDFRTYRMSEDKIPNHTEQLAAPSKDDTTTINISNKDLFPNKLLFKILCALQNITELRTLDLSGNVITEESAEQLAIVLANSTKLKTLLLEDCSLGNEGVNVIVNSLKNITTLKELWLSWDSITEVAVNDIVAVLECNTGLEEVYLDGSLQPCNQFSAAIKEIKVKVLMIDYKLITNGDLANSIISNSKLECLILKNYSSQVTGILVFKTSSKNIKSLKVGKLKTNRIPGPDPSTVMAIVDDSNIIVRCMQNILASTGIMRVVSAFKGVTSVTLFNETLDEYTNKDIDEILIAMACYTELKELNVTAHSTMLHNRVFHSLSNCKLSSLLKVNTSSKFHANTAAKLVSLLDNNKRIQKLNLGNCLFTSSQVAEITNALKKHTGITLLHLHYNNITNVPDNIAQVLLKNQSLQRLYIDNNRLQAKGVIKILEALKQLHNINELCIGRNNIADSISDDTEEIRLYDLLVEVITSNLNLEILEIDKVCKCADGMAKVVIALKSLSHLKWLDISFSNINEVVADDIAMVITNNSNLTTLYMANNYLGVAGTSIIAKALAYLRVLEVLDITNNSISVEAAQSIIEIIKYNPQLKKLILGMNCLIKRNNSNENKLVLSNTNSSSDSLSIMSLSDVFINKQMLEIKHITKIYGPQNAFIHCIITSGNFCCKLLSSNSVLDSSHLINFNCNILQSSGIKGISKALATIKSLEVLSIENNDVDDEAADDIAAAMKSNNGIKQLWIGQNHFTPSGISTILQSFLEKPRISSLQHALLLLRAIPEGIKPTLEILDLSCSNLSQQTAVDVSAVLTKNDTIQQLWLEGNNLSSQCITTIADALKKCTNISVLSLRDNNISEEVADVLSEALSNKCDLQQLYLGNNHLQDRGVIKITEALNTTEYLLTLDLMNNNISEAAADALASVITSCSQLEQLYLGDNKLQSTGTIKITRALQQAKCRSTLRVLDLSNNRIGSDETVGDEISRAVGNTEILTVLILDDNAISVDGVWKITRSLSQSAEYMMIFSLMRNDVMISEETKDKMIAVMAGQQPDCAMYL